MKSGLTFEQLMERASNIEDIPGFKPKYICSIDEAFAMVKPILNRYFPENDREILRADYYIEKTNKHKIIIEPNEELLKTA